jgi:hypothetical protein
LVIKAGYVGRLYRRFIPVLADKSLTLGTCVIFENDDDITDAEGFVGGILVHMADKSDV